MKALRSILLMLVMVCVLAACVLYVSAGSIGTHFTSGSNLRTVVGGYYKAAWASSGTMTPSCSPTGSHYLRCTIGSVDTGRVIKGYGFKLTSNEIYTNYPLTTIAYAYYGTA